MQPIDKQSPFKKVAVIGLGYIGLPTAAILASRKLDVLGVDINQQAVDTINAGKVHFIEPELDMVVHAAVLEGYLKASTEAAVADAFIIAVPTPFKANHEPDLTYIQAAAQSIAPVLKKGDLVLLESTSPVGTTEQLATWLSISRPDLTFPHTHCQQPDIHIAYCPERVLPGHVLHELVVNDRIIGGLTEACSQRALQLYQLFVEGDCLITNARTAEMCKLTENSFRDVNIAFANELSMICDKLAIDVRDLIRLANHHPRVNILKPGPGVGGHCIAVDPWFIVSRSPEEARLIKAAREINDSKPSWVVGKIQAALDAILQQQPSKSAKDITITFLGLAFKADIDDLRESPALEIVKRITWSHPGHVLVVEPNITTLPDDLMGRVELQSMEQALSETDLVVRLVPHKSFISLFQTLAIDAMILDFCGDNSNSR